MRDGFRCAARMALASLIALIAAGAARATPVTVLMTGQWTSVADTASVLDGSIVVGSAFSVTIAYDDAASDQDPDPLVGGYIFPAATSDLTISSGNYSFIAGSDLILGIEDNHNGDDVLALYADHYSIVGALKAGVSVATPAYANPAFFDSSQSAHSSDRLTELSWNLSRYQIRSQDFVLFIAINDGSGPLEYVELLGQPLSATVLPEPAVGLLLAAGSVLLASRRAARR